ncbi:MAG: glycyl-radical enzyme activating protein [Acidaminococcales bacterium]|jgi:pyruvate formate lyase activating enzyme|nr:glycyl-radical enzyme activating protein [Acidaminococcales bacterium]
MEIVKGLSGYVFNIQRFSTHDGPGIRTTVFLKGCHLRCFWCQNPESQDMMPVLMVRKQQCVLCGRCVQSCPQRASNIIDGRMLVNRSRCKACGVCTSACLSGLRNVQGKLMTVGEVMETVLKDYAIYLNSGGGMTISGGAIELQADFAAALLKRAQEEGVHTCVEMAGAYPWPTIKKIADHCDYILYDLKHMDSEKHKEGVGAPNEHVLENARRLVAEKKEILFRTPLIPGYNDSYESVSAIASFVRNELGLCPADHIELLPYNNLGEEKYGRMDFKGEHPAYKRQSDEYLAKLEEIIRAS